MAPSSRRTADTTSRQAEGTSRRVKKSDTPTERDVAQEAAAIYPDTFDTPPTPDEIAVEAYYIYCERGQEEGCDVEHWLEAERRISERRTTSRPEGQNED